MKAKSLSANILKNTIKNWADFCHRSEKFNWTKHDANALLMLINEVKRIEHANYLKHKAKKANPYLDTDEPYHTT